MNKIMMLMLMLMGVMLSSSADMNASKSKKGNKVYPKGVIQTH